MNMRHKYMDHVMPSVNYLLLRWDCSEASPLAVSGKSGHSACQTFVKATSLKCCCKDFQWYFSCVCGGDICGDLLVLEQCV